MTTRTRTRWVMVVAALAASPALWADAPEVIPFVGHLDLGGQPVNGTRTMRFDVYDDPVVGTSLYNETLISVRVVAGSFAVILGGSNTSPSLAEVLGQPGKRYVAVTLVGAGSGGSDVTLGHRQELVSVPYAVQARFAEKGREFVAASVTATDVSATNVTATNASVGGRLALGLQVVTSTGSWVATCPSGKYAVGGGVQCVTHSGSYHAPVHASFPDGAASWRGECISQSLGSLQVPESVYVVCARLGP